MANKIDRPSVKRAAFLAAYATCGNLSAAARSAGVARSKHYEWMQDEAYQAAFKEAHQMAIEALEEEARERATKGVAEPVVYQGQLCYEPLHNGDGTVKVDKQGRIRYAKHPTVIWKKSDVLLMFMLKKLDPSYRENHKIEHTGPGGAPLSFQVKFVKPE